MKRFRTRLRGYGVNLILTAALALTPIFLYNNCAPSVFTQSTQQRQEVITGNPKPQAISINISSSQTESVRQVVVCPQSLAFLSADPNVPDAIIELSGIPTSLGKSLASLGTSSLSPPPKFTRVELVLERSAHCNSTLNFVNDFGNFDKQEQMTLSLDGDASITDATVALTLDLENQINVLAGISSAEDIGARLSTSIGRFSLVNGPEFIQLQTGMQLSPSNSVSTAQFSSNVAKGNFIACAVAFDNPKISLVSIGDSASNGYSRVDTKRGVGPLSNWKLETWTSADVKSVPSFSVTANFSGSFGGEKKIVCLEYTGIYPDNPVQPDAQGGYGEGANMSTVPILARHPNGLVFAAALFSSPNEVSAIKAQRRIVFGNLIVSDRAISTQETYGISFANPFMAWIYNSMLARGF